MIRRLSISVLLMSLSISLGAAEITASVDARSVMVQQPFKLTIEARNTEGMPVVKHRQFARTVAGLPIQGREISMANKQELLAAIRSAIA